MSRIASGVETELRPQAIQEILGGANIAELQTLKKRVKIYPEKVNRVRAKKPKSKTGCKTCKARHVKCDEGKPSCLKCLKFGVDCDGYEKAPPTPSRQKASIPSPKTIRPITALFHNEIDYQYFLHFRDEITIHIAGPVPISLWRHIVLQACNNELPLRNLMISIAALNKSKGASNSEHSHHEYAIRQYGKALRSIREMLIARTDDHTIRTSLIASLLIFTFENLHGNSQLAIAQIEAALKLMHKRLSLPSRRYSQIKNQSYIPGLEHEITEAFVRLDNNIISRLDDQTQTQVPRKSVLEMTYLDPDFLMPVSFKTLQEAKNHLEHFQFRAMPYLSHFTDTFILSTPSYHFSSSAYAKFLFQLQQWSSGFQPILEEVSAVNRRGNPEYASAMMVKSMAIATQIALKSLYFGAGEGGGCDREGAEILELARKVMAHWTFKKSFVFDCGVVPAVFITALACTDRSMKREAVDMLKEMGERVEILWSAREVGGVAEQLMMLQEGLSSDKELGLSRSEL